MTGFDALAFANGILAGQILHCPACFLQFFTRELASDPRFGPAEVGNKGVERLDFIRQAAILASLAGLTLEAGELALHFRRHFCQALEVRLGTVQFQFGFMTTGVEAGNAGGLLENAAAVLRFRSDQFGDLALPNECGGVRTSGGIGKQ